MLGLSENRVDGRISRLFAVRSRLMIRRKNLQCLARITETWRCCPASTFNSADCRIPTDVLRLYHRLVDAALSRYAKRWTIWHGQSHLAVSLEPIQREACNQSPCRGISNFEFSLEGTRQRIGKAGAIIQA